MGRLVVLNLGAGDLAQGYRSVVAQWWTGADAVPMQATGGLPPAPEIASLYSQWQHQYEALYAHRQWRRARSTLSDFELDDDQSFSMVISEKDFQSTCEALHHHLNTWLQSSSFQGIERQLRTHLSPADAIRMVIVGSDRTVLRLPWLLWQFFEDYPHAESAFSLPDYTRRVKTSAPRTHSTVRILAVLGSATGLDLTVDRQMLEHIPDAELVVLVQPTLADLERHLWDSAWDLFFFAGHSSSGERGILHLNDTDSLTVPQLRYAMQRAIANGLKLALFNSCDGLGLAWDLADLQIPQVIVMREPVPDRVAQLFLNYFLLAFSQGRSLYEAVREARERLQSLEVDYPCATWLPVICQNPAEPSPAWQDWCSALPLAGDLPSSTAPATSPSPPLISPKEYGANRWLRGAIAILGLTAGIVGLRWTGLLQPVELWAFDRLLQSRPVEPPDHRLLIITIDEADIQAQPLSERRGSLSDAALSDVIQTLNQHGAAVIGLDLYRDAPIAPVYADLITQFQTNDRLIGICKSSDRLFDPTGTGPPPDLPSGQLGFSDFLVDPDGTLRRQILFLTPEANSPCPAAYSFSVRVAFRYLLQSGIEPTFTPQGNLQLGETIFPRLHNHSGGYHRIDDAGNQVVLNYRALHQPGAIAPQIPLTHLQTGAFDPALIRDRIVLIGVTAPSGGDYWDTPYRPAAPVRTPGVVVQAHMISQILSAVLDGRSLIWMLPQWLDSLWIAGWTGVGLGIGWLRRSLRWRMVGTVGAVVLLLGSAVWAVSIGLWIPLIPTLLGLGVAVAIAPRF